MESIRTHSRYVGNIYAGLYNKNLIFKLQDLPYDTFDVVSTEKIIKKISKGCAKTLFEKIKG